MIDLRIHDNTKTKVADASDDCSTREFFVEIIRALHPGAKVEEWDLRDAPDGKPLALDRTLEENQLRSHQDLYLVAKENGRGPEPRFCRKCKSPNTANVKICTSCGTGLDPKGSDDLKLEVKGPDGKSVPCTIAGDTHAAELLGDLLEAFALPRLDGKGRRIAYRLVDQESQTALDVRQTLDENGAFDGQRLVLEDPRGPDNLRLEVTAPDQQARHIETPSSTRGAEFTGILIEQFSLPATGTDGKPIAYFLTDAKTKVALDAKKTLAESGVSTGQHLLLRTTDKVRLPRAELRVQGFSLDGRSHQCTAAADTPTSELLGDLIGVFALPKFDAQSRPILYVLRNQQSGKVLASQLTLAQNDVVNEQHLLVTRKEHELPSPPVFLAWVRQHALPILLGFIAVFACAALTWVAIRASSRRHSDVSRTSVQSKPASSVSPTSASPATSVVQSGADHTALPNQIDQPTTSGAGKASEGADSSASAPIAATPLPPEKIFPTAVSLGGSESQHFVVKPAPDTPVQWSVSPKAGSVSRSGVYTAPSLIATRQTVKVIADAGKPVAATVTLEPAAIAGITSAKGPKGTLVFSASVTHASNPAVTWSITPQVGSMSSQGVYTPAGYSPYKLQVTARSVADPSKMAVVVLPIVPEDSGIRVTLNHFNPVIMDNQREKLSATVTGAADPSVTWTMVGTGQMMPDGTYIAPQLVPPGDHTIHLMATSNADPSKRAEGDLILRHGHTGPTQGTLVWSGDLKKNSTLTITDSQPDAGRLAGSLPGVPVTVRVTTPKCTLVTAPNAWKTIVIRTGSHLKSISIDWSAEP